MTQAFLVGATGEVGKHVLAQLLASPQFSRVVVLSRRPIDYDGPKKDALVNQALQESNAFNQSNIGS